MARESLRFIIYETLCCKNNADADADNVQDIRCHSELC